jgi:hypothetical protein
MQTGIISFGDRVAWNIKCNNIKDIILNELLSLYNVRIIQKHYYNIDDNNIKYISKLPHLISLRSNGNRYYIYFSLYNDTPIIYFIDMKIHTGYEKPRIILARGLFDPSLFKNTLLDGEMIKTNENKWIFIINDIIAYEGKKLDDVVLPERLKIIYNILDKKYTPDDICDVCSYKVKNYYYLSKKSLNELMTISKELNYTSRGIYFSSYYLKHKPKLYNFNDNIIVSVQKKVKDITEFKELVKDESSSLPSSSSLASSLPLPLPLPPATIIASSNIITPLNKSYTDLWISKTDDPDIYNIYDNHNILTSNKLGIAFIGSLQDSIKMRNVFKDKSTTITIKFKCNYNEKFKKFQPIEQII